MEKQITINSRKYDGTIHRSWKAKLLEETDDYWLFFGRFENEVLHNSLGTIKRGTISYEYYWKKKWFNIFRFHEPDGLLRNFYCNVNFPPELLSDSLDYIDLDLDVLVWDDSRIEILDEEEFEFNSLKYGYPKEVISRANQSIVEIKNMIFNNAFPFIF